MTKCRFALYDPAHRSPDGSYWTWRADGLDVGQLNRLYYDVAAKNCPPEPNRLRPGDVWGGIAELGEDQVGVYLFFNGGRDLLGRPGRFVLLATLLERKEVQDRDLSAIFHCTLAQWVSEKRHRRVRCHPPRVCTKTWNCLARVSIQA